MTFPYCRGTDPSSRSWFPLLCFPFWLEPLSPLVVTSSSSCQGHLLPTELLGPLVGVLAHLVGTTSSLVGIYSLLKPGHSLLFYLSGVSRCHPTYVCMHFLSGRVCEGRSGGCTLSAPTLPSVPDACVCIGSGRGHQGRARGCESHPSIKSDNLLCVHVFLLGGGPQG